MRDYYAVLGVLPSAELTVIKGAYKAMMTIYHPDKFQGDKDFAHAKTIEIQEAYNVLKDPARRAVYDETLGTKHEYTEEKQEAQASSDEERKFNTDHWYYALKYHPELAAYEQELSIVSPSLAMQFRLVLIETKKFGRAFELSHQLKQEYFERFFGQNLKVIEFAEFLLITGHRDAAKELNKAINFLGASVDARKLIESIKQEFGLEYESKTNKPIKPIKPIKPKEDIGSSIVICSHCNARLASEYKNDTNIALGLFLCLLYVLPGVIYFLYKSISKKKCPWCGAS